MENGAPGTDSTKKEEMKDTMEKKEESKAREGSADVDMDSTENEAALTAAEQQVINNFGPLTIEADENVAPPPCPRSAPFQSLAIPKVNPLNSETMDTTENKPVQAVQPTLATALLQNDLDIIPEIIKQKKEYAEVKSSYQAESDSIYDPTDKYKREGRLRLVIDNFLDFVREPPEKQQRLSKSVFVRGLPWKILAIPRSIRCQRTQKNQKALGFFLQCLGDSEAANWTCIAQASLRIHSRKEGVEDHVRRICHTFYPKENDWGYSQFMSYEHLLNQELGYMDEKGAITLSVTVHAEAPHGTQWDSKKHTGYVGLKNQGATCYMNSILQTLYFTNILRKAVYQLPMVHGEDMEASVALAMQRVFFDLSHMDKPVGTKKLTKSFGWDSLDSFLQHDVQELCRVLLDNLETKMKGTTVEGMIPKLFKGQMESYIKCTEVDYESSRQEIFYDVQLNVRPKDQSRFEKGRSFNIIDSFRDYVDAERLDGENKYDAGQFGLQSAEKGVRFLSFPRILHLQLMRFQFDPNLETTVKVNDRFEFTDIIDLNEFVPDRAPEDDYTYVLHAVLVHTGDFHGGHYVVYINTDVLGAASKWCKFDDDVVSRSSFKDSVFANFGGDDGENVLGRTYTNAYMLVYIRKNAVDEVLAPVTDGDIPYELRTRFQSDHAEEMRKKKDKLDAHLYMDFQFITEDMVKAHKGWDLFDVKYLEQPESHHKMTKILPFFKFYEHIDNKFIDKTDDKPHDFRLWVFHENDVQDERGPISTKSLRRYRPTQILNLDADNSHKKLEDVFDSEKVIIFIERPIASSNGPARLVEYHEKTDIMIHLKYFDSELKEIRYMGHIVVHFRQILDAIMPIVAERAGIPAGTRLRFYEEISPDKIRNIESTTIPLCSDSMLSEVNDGGILIFERIDMTTMADNAKTFLEDKYNTITVEIQQNDDSSQFACAIIDTELPFTGRVNLNWSCLRLSQYVGEQMGWDPTRILLWRLSPYAEKPTQYVNDSQLKIMKVKDLLSLVGDNVHDPRKNRKYKIFYNKVPIAISDMDKKRQMRIHLMDDKFNITEATVFPDKNGTVAQILEEAKRIFKFAPNGTGVLRLMYVGFGSPARRVFSIYNNDELVSNVNSRGANVNQYQIRAEEVPADQLMIGPNEFLLPIIHFEKDPATRQFGVPFWMKVTEGEPLATIRIRIRERLEVPEKEFEKWKFAILSGTRLIRYLDADNEDQPKARFDLHGDSRNIMSPTIYLGLDHFNRNRNTRGGQPEKPIVIHN